MSGNEAANTGLEGKATEQSRVSDEALSSAWDAANQNQNQSQQSSDQQPSQQEPQVDKPVDTSGPQQNQSQQSPPKDDLLDQNERTRIGRRLKRQEDEILELKYGINELLRRADSQNQHQNVPPQNREPEIVATTADLDRWYAQRRQSEASEQQRQAQAYGSTYYRSLRGLLSKEEEGLAGELLELTAGEKGEFNVMSSQDPVAAARINLAEARAKLYQKRVTSTQQKANVQGERTSTGFTVNNRQSAPVNKLPELDDASKEFMRISGMSEESAINALKDETPNHLRRR